MAYVIKINNIQNSTFYAPVLRAIKIYSRYYKTKHFDRYINSTIFSPLDMTQNIDYCLHHVCVLKLILL